MEKSLFCEKGCKNLFMLYTMCSAQKLCTETLLRKSNVNRPEEIRAKGAKDGTRCE